MTDVVINFRETNAGAYANIEAAGQVRTVLESINNYDNGPTNRGGYTFGWINTSQFGSSNLRDRDNTNDPRLAGMAFQTNDGTTSTFRVDMVAGHTYNIGLALGDAGNARSNTYVLLKDNATTFATINVAAGTSAGEWIDATGVKRTSDADWISNNAKVTRTFTSSLFYVVLGTPTSTGDVTAIASLSIADVGSGTATMAFLLMGPFARRSPFR